MIDQNSFDLWADTYDSSVRLSEEFENFPFAGYHQVLSTLYAYIMKMPHPRVLGLGFGTATLTSKLFKMGCDIYGQDFLPHMIQLTSQKIPQAHLYKGDFTQGLVDPLQTQSYDFIVASYAFHHLTDEQKITFLNELLATLRKVENSYWRYSFYNSPRIRTVQT